MKLRRKTHFDGQTFENEMTWMPMQDLVRRYKVPRLQGLVDGHYSKLDAILHPGKGAVTEELCRALLTDTGLLFAQTREHGYPMSYSRRRQESSRKLNLALYHVDAVNPPPAVTDDSTGQALLLDHAKGSWAAYTGSTNSAGRVQDCIRTLLERCGSVAAFACIEVSGADDFFYCVKDETARSLSGEDDNNCVCTADLHRCTIRLPGGQSLCLDELCADLTTNEGRIFLRKVLLPCMAKAEELAAIRELLEMEYRPVIAGSQLSAMTDQLRRFNKETLDNWRKAQEILAAVYAPDVERYKGKRLSAYKRAATMSLSGDLAAHIERYITGLGLNEDVSLLWDRSVRLADYFTRVFSVKNGDVEQIVPAFLDQPWVIFQLVRTPAFLRLFEEGRESDVFDAVKTACIDLPIPFTEGRLADDKKLFFGILDVCERGCSALHITFPHEAWRQLWPCIEESARCLRFSPHDLLTFQSTFTVTARNTRRYAPHSEKRDLDSYFGKAMDRWLYDSLCEDFKSFSPQLWRALYNMVPGMCCRYGRDPAEEFVHNWIAPYERLFADPSADESDVIELAQRLIEKVSWNRFSFLPKEDDIKKYLEADGIRIVNTKLTNQLQKEIKEGAETKVVHSSEVSDFVKRFRDSGRCRDGAKKKNAARDVNDLRTLITEWALLQMTCARAQMKLIEYIARALEREKK